MWRTFVCVYSCTRRWLRSSIHPSIHPSILVFSSSSSLLLLLRCCFNVCVSLYLCAYNTMSPGGSTDTVSCHCCSHTKLQTQIRLSYTRHPSAIWSYIFAPLKFNSFGSFSDKHCKGSRNWKLKIQTSWFKNERYVKKNGFNHLILAIYLSTCLFT